MVTPTGATGSYVRVSFLLVAALDLVTRAGTTASSLTSSRLSIRPERIGDSALVRRAWSIFVEIPKALRLDRTASSSVSRRGPAAGRWHRCTRRIGTVIVLVILLMGMLPAWQIGGAGPAA